MPVLPFINDNEENIKNIIKSAYECGAKFVFSYGLGVTLRQNQREYYFEQLRRIFPNQGLDKNIETYGESYENGSRNYDHLLKVFKRRVRKYNLLYDMKDIIADYKRAYEKSSN